MSVTGFNKRRRELYGRQTEQGNQSGQTAQTEQKAPEEMTIDELRTLGKELKIKSAHNMKPENLIEKIKEMRNA